MRFYTNVLSLDKPALKELSYNVLYVRTNVCKKFDDELGEYYSYDEVQYEGDEIIEYLDTKQVESDQLITELELNQFQTEQMLTEMDLKILELEEQGGIK